MSTRRELRVGINEPRRNTRPSDRMTFIRATNTGDIYSKRICAFFNWVAMRHAWKNYWSRESKYGDQDVSVKIRDDYWVVEYEMSDFSGWIEYNNNWIQWFNTVGMPNAYFEMYSLPPYSFQLIVIHLALRSSFWRSESSDRDFSNHRRTVRSLAASLSNALVPRRKSCSKKTRISDLSMVYEI